MRAKTLDETVNRQPVAPPVVYPPMNFDQSRVVTRSAGPNAWTVVIWGFAGLVIFCSGGLGVYMVLGMPIEEVRSEAGQSGPELVSPAPFEESNQEPAVEIPAPATVNEEQAVPVSSLSNSLPAPPLDDASALLTKSGDAPSESPMPIVGAAILPQDTVVEVKAFAGEPFGVGKITVDFPEDRRPTWHADQFIHLEGLRTLYPAFDVRHVSSTGEYRAKVDRYECHFLLQGREPIAVELTADTTYSGKAIPTDDSESHRRLMNAWWRTYDTPRRLFSAKYDKPGPAHDYLTSMLARRLDLSRSHQTASSGSAPVLIWLLKPLLRLLPGQSSPGARSSTPNSSFMSARLKGSLVFDFDRFLGLLFGTESMRHAFLPGVTLAGADRSEVADRPLANPVTIPPVRMMGGTSGAIVEPIAYHVPEECFYLRCGSLAEYLWLRNLVVRWGGSLSDLISTEAVDYKIRARIERQLSFSPKAAMHDELDGMISDMALIGTDILFQDGAALGVLFEAKNGPALDQLIRRQREKTLRECPQATEEKIDLGSGRASFISTPDHRVRSFYTTNSKIVKFLTKLSGRMAASV